MKVEYPELAHSSNGAALLLGSGGEQLAGWVGCDKFAVPGVHVVHDLDYRPWPFESESVGRIRASFLLEHLREPTACLEEIYRICQDRARVEVAVPYWNSICFSRDITHLRGFHENNFLMLDSRRKRHKHFYPACDFDVVKIGVLIFSGHYPVWNPTVVRILLGIAPWIPNIVRDLVVVMDVRKSPSAEFANTGQAPKQGKVGNTQMTQGNEHQWTP